MELSVYLFTGFLDGGKTTVICRMLEEGRINANGRPVLVLLCETGLADYSAELQQRFQLRLERLRTPEDCKLEYLSKLEEKTDFGAVIVELNGFWPCSLIEDNLPTDWHIQEKIFCGDAATISAYASNLPSQTGDKLAYASAAIFYHVHEDGEDQSLHNLVRKYSRRAAVWCLEANGMPRLSRCEEKLLFSPKADPIEVPDSQFGIWFWDLEQNPQRYLGRHIRFRGRIMEVNGQTFFGRHVTTGRAKDATFWCLPVACGKKISPRQEDMWYLMEAELRDGKEEPVLYPSKMQITYPPAQEIAILR